MKRTLICIHSFPHEIEMLERLVNRFRKAVFYLDETDDVTFFIALNLNPRLIDWQASKLSNNYFIDKLNTMMGGLNVKNINVISEDESLLGTTHHKRISITKDYDQFIFCDPDIIFPETLLKNQLNASYEMNVERYIISPAIPRWWDDTWDSLCDSRFTNHPVGSAQQHSVIDETETQTTEDVRMKSVYPLKFGCGMHTLYSKGFWDTIGIPESFKGYGPEDTFAMAIGNYIYDKIPTNQYVLDGVYITEDYRRTPTFINDIVMLNNKDTSRQNANVHFQKEARNVLQRLGYIN